MKKLLLILLLLAPSPALAELITVTANGASGCDHYRIVGNTTGRKYEFTLEEIRAPLVESEDKQGNELFVLIQIKARIRDHLDDGGANTLSAIRTYLQTRQFILPPR